MRTKRLGMLVSLAVVMLLASAVLADDLPEMKFEKYELPNGLDVILQEDHSIPMVAVNVWYHVGSKNEKPGKTGFAHLFEHLMFEGSEHHNELFHSGIDKYGGTNNGSTTEDRTNYWENVPSNYLEKILWLEADRMGYLLPAIDQQRLDLQRDVVKNEKRERYVNQPYGKVEELQLGLLYPKEHPYSHSVIGSMEDLTAASLDDVKDFFHQYYTPNNASLCIAGDFDPQMAKAWVEKYFGPIPPGPAVDRLDSWVPVLTEERTAEAEDNVSLPRLYLSWHTPAFYAPGDAEFDLLASILASGKSSRLYKTLVYDKQIAQDVFAYQASRELESTFNIVVTAKQGQSLKEIKAEVDKILDDVRTKGVTQKELDLARVNWEARFVRGLQRIGGFGGRADILNQYNVYLGDPGKLLWDRDRYSNATVKDINGYAAKYLQPSERAVLYIYPEGELAASETQTDMTAEPAAAPEPSFTPPSIQSAELSNGMKLMLVENQELPLVQINLLIKSGWAADPKDRPGAGALTAEMLNEGTKTRSALDISDEAALLGANLGSVSSFDYSTVSLNILKKNLDKGLALMADITQNPTFPQEELDRLKKTYLGRIQQESKQPFTTAVKAYYYELYGPNHPYAQPYTGSGTEESINAITRADLEEYYRANYLPNNAVAIVVGDISLAEAKDKLEKAFKKWQPGQVFQPAIANAEPLKKTKVCIVDKPGAAQSVIILGNLTIPRENPDFTTLEIANHILGGQSTARLNMNLRQDKGYTYGSYSFITGRKGQGSFTCYAQVQTEVTKESLAEFMKELNGITGTIPITQTELKDSEDNLTKGFPQDFETFRGIAGQMNSIAIFNLPANEWQTYISRIDAVDIKAAEEAAKKYIHPDQLLIVVVGDREKIEPGIKELNLGDIVNLDPSQI